VVLRDPLSEEGGKVPFAKSRARLLLDDNLKKDGKVVRIPNHKEGAVLKSWEGEGGGGGRYRFRGANTAQEKGGNAQKKVKTLKGTCVRKRRAEN